MTMRRTQTTLLTLTALALSCGPGVFDPMPDIPEVVEYDTVRIDYGGDDGIEATTDDETTRVGALVGARSKLADTTLDTIRNTNGVIYGVLKQVEDIIATPVTEYADGVWTWEASRPLRSEYIRFVLEELEPIEQEGAVSATRFKLDFGRSRVESSTIYEGTYYSFGRDAAGRQRGAGTIAFYFDEARRYDEDSATGTMRVSFRVNNGVRQVNTHLDELKGPRARDETLTALYTYTQLPDGFGRFTYFTRGDVFGRDEVDEFVGVDVAWTPEREGRARASITGGSLEEIEVLRRQCWDSDQIVTYEQNTPAPFGDDDAGSPDDCAASLRDVELREPTYTAPPSSQPPIPGRHPRE